ncbi:trypsin-like serine peptidase [Candidatus Soleaferrea massiliensis]|uniref:trypsin-like serine peptidase n=1 Tax=Candidatus Soleaferrea massiliensis TaxID=1470354 RepID=UPI00059160A2|nr:trypsin-like peptidase domain-containing protein [Candidatus Soleaferrea massiliensis]
MKSKLLKCILLSITILSAAMQPTATLAASTDYTAIPIETFVVETKDTVTGEISQEMFDTSITAQAKRSGINELTAPAFRGTAPEINYNISPFSIIGPDNRYRVNTSIFPYRAICSISAYFDTNGDGRADKTALGTGFFEGPSAVVSCGHVIYDKDYGWCMYADVTPGKNGRGTSVEINPYGHARSTTIHTSTAWINNKDWNQDWAVIEIDKALGNKTGWMGKHWRNYSMNGETVYISGYHQDKNFEQWKSAGKIVASLDARIEYDCDMISGSSGSPVYWGDGIAVGINSYHGTGKNGGTRITEWLFNYLQQYNGS